MQQTPTCDHCQNNYELKDFRPVGPKIPLILRCGHTFCEGCLTRAAKNKPEINCFACETPILLDPNGEKGVKNFLPNIYMLGLLLYNRRMTFESSECIHGGAVSIFNGIGSIPRSKNVECSQQFSKSFDSNEILEKETLADLCCPIHKGRKLEFYDKSYKEYVCALCIISERCKDHEIVLVSEMENELNEELENAVVTAKETLRWYDYSYKTLTDALLEEVTEANYVFLEIHHKFTACHTLLLKRQMEVMSEASEKILTNGSVNNMLQELSIKLQSLTDALKEYELATNNKQATKTKAKEFIQRFTELSKSTCIVERNNETDETNISFIMPDSIVDDIESYGEIKQRKFSKFVVKSIDDIPAEERKNILHQNENENKKLDVIQTSEILDENVPLKLKNYSKLSLLSGYNELVFVTYVKDPTDFRVQRCADRDRLQEMMGALNKYCKYSNKSTDLVHKTEEGELVCAQFLADNYWYRARVINNHDAARADVTPTWSNGLCVEVLYIDYGNSERLPLNRLRVLKERFLDLPEMAVPCSLTDIVPPMKENCWSERSIKTFNSLTGQRPLLMNIRKRIGGKLYVDLRKPDNDEFANDDRPISVRDAMVFLEAAVFFSPASQPNSTVHRQMRSYLEPEPLQTNTYIDVTVTHTEDPHSIYIQRLDSIILDEQHHLSQLYSDKNNRTWRIDWPYKNLVCAAKFTGDKTWYRAVVKHVHMNDTVDVEYVDYGNSETLPFSDIKNIPPMYLNLPKQCWKVRLYHVDLLDGTTQWPDTVKTMLRDLCNEPYVVVVKDFAVGNIACVELFDTSTAEDISINKLLVDKGFAKSVGMRFDPGNKTSQLVESIKVKANIENVTVPTSLPQYLPPVLPTETIFSATGVYVDDHGIIYLHIMNEDSSLTQIMKDLQDDASLFAVPSTTENIYVGQPCIGLFAQDNLWYRVKVVEITSHNTVNIEFIDFGNTEHVNVNTLYLSPKYLEIPSQCIGVELANVKPKDSRDLRQYVEFISSAIVSEHLKVELLPCVTTDNHCAVTIWNEDGVSIADLLISKDLVAPCSEKSGTEAKKTQLKNLQLSESHISKTSQVSSTSAIHESNYLWYRKQRLPPPGRKFDVQVTQVIQPNSIFIQRFPPDIDDMLLIDDADDMTSQIAYEEIEELEKINDTINSTEYITNTSLHLPKPIIGMACVGKYSEDNLYYRAKIESIDEMRGVAEVMFVDYGNSETVPISSLKALLPRHVQLPMQSTQVKIAGIKPLSQGGQWSIDDRKQFFFLVANKRLIGQVVNYSEDLPVIHLYDRCLVEDGDTGETMDLLIGKLLKERRVANYELTTEEKKMAS